MKYLLLCCTWLLLMPLACAQIHGENYLYSDGDVQLEGFVAYEAQQAGKKPLVIVVAEWTGINEYTRKRCRMLAEMGYIAFAADVYGKGVRPATPEAAGMEASKYRENRPLLQQRMLAALQTAKSLPQSDTSRIAVIGYCFGGTAALELGRSGANIQGIVSFHGGLSNPQPENTENIQARVLICHGALDPHVSDEEVDGFINRMNSAGIDYQFIYYAGAVHSFTNPGAGNDPSTGNAYDASADARSWEHMQLFFYEIFR